MCVRGTRCSGSACEHIVDLGDCCEYTPRTGWWASGSEPECDVGECVDGRCEPIAAIGCPCQGDRTCPLDVAECIDGVCEARPMPGDVCRTAGPACFGSACHEGVCQPGRLGDACGLDGDCERDLVCAGPWLGPRACGPLLAEGEACGVASILGRCADGLVCGESNLCGPVLGRGAPCGAGVPGTCDAATLYCDGADGTPTCELFARVGQPCSDTLLCLPGLVCTGGVCSGP